MTTVVYFENTYAGAPQITNALGSMIGVLDACLVNGFNLLTASGLTVASGVATLSFGSAHNYPIGSIIEVAGATPAGLNGRKRVVTVAANSLTFSATGIADGAATGTISARFAPAGWEKVFSGTNLAVYRSANVLGTRCFLRVDDSQANNVRVVGYESMSDVNTGVGLFPTPAQVSGGLFWARNSDANTSARAWQLIADSRTFYLRNSAINTNALAGPGFWFGDFASYRSGDAYACSILGANSVRHILNSATPSHGIGTILSPNERFVARSSTGLGGSVACDILELGPSMAAQSGGSGSPFNYPNTPNNGLILSRASIRESSTLRGLMRGLYLCSQDVRSVFYRTPGARIAGQGDLAGRELVVVPYSSDAASSVNEAGVVFFDVTGPWD